MKEFKEAFNLYLDDMENKLYMLIEEFYTSECDNVSFFTKVRLMYYMVVLSIFGR